MGTMQEEEDMILERRARSDSQGTSWKTDNAAGKASGTAQLRIVKNLSAKQLVNHGD